MFDDRFDVVAGVAVETHHDGALDARQGMLGQELQDADVLPRASGKTAPLFQVGAQLREHRR